MQRHKVKVGMTVYRKHDGRPGTVVGVLRERYGLTRAFLVRWRGERKPVREIAADLRARPKAAEVEGGGR